MEAGNGVVTSFGPKTLTCTLALTPLPSRAVAVMVVVPAALPVTTPLELTVATALLLLDQVTVRMEALLGLTAAARVVVPFTATLVAPLIAMEVTGLKSDTALARTYMNRLSSPMFVRT